MKILILIFVVVPLTLGCAGPNAIDTAKEQELSFSNMHCRDHAEDQYASEFAPRRYMECMELHKDGIVLTDSTDIHLTSTHTAKEQEFNFFNMHCRDHAEDQYASEFAPRRYIECMELHKNGIVLTDSTDIHLAGTH